MFSSHIQTCKGERNISANLRRSKVNTNCNKILRIVVKVYFIRLHCVYSEIGDR